MGFTKPRNGLLPVPTRGKEACICLVQMLFLFVAIVAFPLPALSGDAEVGGLQNAVGNVTTRLSQLGLELKDPVSNPEKVDLERRLVDATVFFGMGDFQKASILYYDLLRSPAFRTHSRFLDSKYKLGVCHFKARNFRAAQTVLADLARVRSNFQQDAIVLLIESSLNVGDEPALDQVLAQIERLGSSAGDATRYVQGKAEYRKERYSRALEAFSRVSPRAPQYVAARYYRGVILTETGELDTAMMEFQQVIASKPVQGDSPLGEEEDYGEVKELARLAAARIMAEKGEVAKAIELYQDVDRRSPSFEVALFEMAWLLVEEENYDKALHTLEVLILIAKDERILANANNMKSRILMKLSRYEEASEGYGSVLDNFSPIQRELERVARSEKRLDEYFDWLIERKGSNYDSERPMTSSASVFVETSQTIRPVASVFSQLGEEGNTLDEAGVLVGELQSALEGHKRYELVPDLAEKWARLLSAENDLIRIQSRLLDEEQELFRSFSAGEDVPVAKELQKKRRAAEARFLAEVPEGPVDYRQRSRELERRIRDLERESFLARQLLEKARGQLDAVEEWLNDPEQTGLEVGGLTERKARMRLDEEKKYLGMLNDSLVQAARDIDLEGMRIGVVDLENEATGGLRTELLKLQEAEGKWLRGKLQPAESAKPLAVQNIRAVRAEIRDGFRQAGEISKRLDKNLEGTLRKYVGDVNQERSRLKEYEAALLEEVERSRKFVQEFGYELFRDASAELQDVVLEADLGLIDVSWERKYSEGQRIKALQEERNIRLQELDNSLEEISRDRKTGLLLSDEPQKSVDETEAENE